MSSEGSCPIEVMTSLGETLIVDENMNLAEAEDYCRLQSMILAPVRDTETMLELSKLVQEPCSDGSETGYARGDGEPYWMVGLKYENGTMSWSDGSAYVPEVDGKLFEHELLQPGWTGEPCEATRLFTSNESEPFLQTYGCDSTWPFFCVKDPRLAAPDDSPKAASQGGNSLLLIVLPIVLAVLLILAIVIFVLYRRRQKENRRI